MYILLALAPLPFASARPVWHWFWIVYIGIVALIFSAKLWGKWHISEQRTINVAMMLFLFFTVWGFVQATGTVMVKVPAETMFEVGQYLDTTWLLTVDSSQTLTVACNFLAHLLLFYLVLSSCTRRLSAIQMVRICGTIVTVYASYGFVIYVTGNKTILWFEKWGYIDSLTGTFVNRNSFAAFLGLGLQCLVAYTIHFCRGIWSEILLGQRGLQHLFRAEIIKTWWLLLATLLVGTALLLTSSRAGFVSVGIAVFLLLILSFGERSQNRHIRYKVIALGVVVSVSLISLSGDLLLSRLQAGIAFDQRFMVYPLVIDAIADRPILGFGLGTFEDVFRIYRDETIFTVFDRAHSDYLELALTAGIPATLTLLGSFGLAILFLASRLKFGGTYRCFIALGISSSVQLGLHSLVDFPLQMPAISYMWCAMLAGSIVVAERCQQVSNVN